MISFHFSTKTLCSMYYVHNVILLLQQQIKIFLIHNYNLKKHKFLHNPNIFQVSKLIAIPLTALFTQGNSSFLCFLHLRLKYSYSTCLKDPMQFTICVFLQSRLLKNKHEAQLSPDIIDDHLGCPVIRNHRKYANRRKRN